jgi:hypothetical protein
LKIRKRREEKVKEKGYANINDIYNYISKIGFKFHNMMWHKFEFKFKIQIELGHVEKKLGHKTEKNKKASWANSTQFSPVTKTYRAARLATWWWCRQVGHPCHPVSRALDQELSLAVMRARP